MTVYIIQSVSSTYTHTCLDTLWIIYTVRRPKYQHQAASIHFLFRSEDVFDKTAVTPILRNKSKEISSPLFAPSKCHKNKHFEIFFYKPPTPVKIFFWFKILTFLFHCGWHGWLILVYNIKAVICE